MTDNFEEDYILIPVSENEKAVIDVKTQMLKAAWVDGHYVEGKDLSEEFKMKAHAAMRARTFDIVGEENKG